MRGGGGHSNLTGARFPALAPPEFTVSSIMATPTGSRQTLIDWWRTFALDARSLTLFRVGLGLVAGADALLRMPHWRLTLSDRGYAPRESVLEVLSPDRWSLYFLSGNDVLAVGLLVAQVLAGLWLILGFRPRLAAFVLWVLVVSLHNRAPMLLGDGDDYLRLLLLWSVFLPMHRGVGIGAAILGDVGASVRPTLAELGLRVQVISVYLVSVLFATGSWWRNGNAAMEPLLDGRQAPPALGAFLYAPTFVSPMLTSTVLLIGLAAPLLLFAPRSMWRLRTAAVASLAILHVGLGAFFDTGPLLPLVGIVAVIAFLPSELWQTVQRLRRPSRVAAIYYDGGCGFCRSMVVLLAALTGRGDVEVLPAAVDESIAALMEAEHTWVVESTSGRRHIRADALALVLSDAWWTAPLSWVLRVPGIRSIADFAYRLVAGHRPSPTRMAALAGRAPSPRSRLESALTASLLVLTVAVNLAALGHLTPPAPSVVDTLGMQQRWSVFTLRSATATGWFELQASTPAATWDVLGSLAPGSSEPIRMAATGSTDAGAHLGTYRWRQALRNDLRGDPLALIIVDGMIRAACTVELLDAAPLNVRLVHFLDANNSDQLTSGGVVEKTIAERVCIAIDD